jgi:hypothetical protein
VTTRLILIMLRFISCIVRFFPMALCLPVTARGGEP